MALVTTSYTLTLTPAFSRVVFFNKRRVALSIQNLSDVHLITGHGESIAPRETMSYELFNGAVSLRSRGGPATIQVKEESRRGAP